MQKKNTKYLWEATTLEGFVQQLAVGYVARRYFFYVSGRVPKRLTDAEHDNRLIAKFDVAHSKWSRYRRTKRKGPDGRPLANVQYIRFSNFWVLLATAGHHRFFQEHELGNEADVCRMRQYHDVRRKPICFGGYSIGYNKKASVRMSRRCYRELKEHYVRLATIYRSEKRLEREFRRAPFEPYGGVTRQMFSILKAVNVVRKKAGLPQVSREAIRVRRRSMRPFDDSGLHGAKDAVAELGMMRAA